MLAGLRVDIWLPSRLLWRGGADLSTLAPALKHREQVSSSFLWAGVQHVQLLAGYFHADVHWSFTPNMQEAWLHFPSLFSLPLLFVDFICKRWAGMWEKPWLGGGPGL